MLNIRDILSSAKVRLCSGGIVSGDSDAEFLLAHVLGVSRSQLYMEAVISDHSMERFADLISRRLHHEPMDSLIGYTEFLGLKFPFNKDTLTPRQETEIMTDNIIKDHSHRMGLSVLDLCCGSGCIGLSVSKHLNAHVILADISPKVVEIAKENATLNNVDGNFIVSNLFDNVVGLFDIIISNPPYIPSSDLYELESEVKDYDPSLALDGGADGLDFYRKIISEAPKYLKDNGLIYMEFGINQAKDIYNLMQKDFKNIEIVKDYSGIERYIKGQKK